jgi:hypothetical protein
MTSGSARRAAAEGTITSRRLLRRITARTVPAAALVLAAVSIAAAYAISQASSPGGAKLGTSATFLGEGPAVRVDNAFPVERGPHGTQGQWIGDAASIAPSGVGRFWMTFRAESLRVARTLTFVGSASRSVAVHVAPQPAAYVVGPLTKGRYLLQPTPSSDVAPRPDPRRLAIFMSTPRIVRHPVLVTPQAGFWASESAGELLFNWLKQAGTITALAPEGETGSLWLTLITRSLGQPRTLTATSGGESHRIVVPTEGRTVELGPFRLVHGRANIVVSVSPGPRHYGTDPRLLSVQVTDLAAHTSAAG